MSLLLLVPLLFVCVAQVQGPSIRLGARLLTPPRTSRRDLDREPG